MGIELIGLVLNLVVLMFLGATIYYVVRLTKNLENFKAHRKEFDGVIADLLASIDQAERSVNTLKQVSAQEAGELDDLIQQAKAMSDELSIINQAGESMASRLEKLAEKNAQIAKSAASSKHSSSKQKHRVESKITSHVDDDNDYRSTLKKVNNPNVGSNSDFPSFMIQDREFGEDSSLDNEEDDFMPDELKSHAERELLAALRSNKNNLSKGGR